MSSWNEEQGQGERVRELEAKVAALETKVLLAQDGLDHVATFYRELVAIVLHGNHNAHVDLGPGRPDGARANDAALAARGAAEREKALRAAFSRFVGYTRHFEASVGGITMWHVRAREMEELTKAFRPPHLSATVKCAAMGCENQIARGDEACAFHLEQLERFVREIREPSTTRVEPASKTPRPTPPRLVARPLRPGDPVRRAPAGSLRYEHEIAADHGADTSFVYASAGWHHANGAPILVEPRSPT